MTSGQKGTGGISYRLIAFGGSRFLPVLSYLTRTLLLRKIGQGIRKMYLAPMRGFFYACMRVIGRWVICDRSRIQGLRRFWRCIAPVICSTCH